MSIEEHGLSVSLPSGWNGRIFTHVGDVDSDNRPTLHMASFALPQDEGDFGTDVIAAMTANDAFMSLVEYTPDCLLPEVDVPATLADVNLDPAASVFSSNGIPVVNAGDFSPSVVLGDTLLPAVTAVQYPFLAAGRPFVLYVVVGDAAQLSAKVGQANAILSTLVISPAITCKFDALNVTFQNFYTVPLIDLVGTEPAQGTCSGSGSGTAVLARSDGGASKSLTASLTFSGDYHVGEPGKCYNSLYFQGILTAALSDGRSVGLPVSFQIPVLNEQKIVGTVVLRNDPIELPVVFTLLGGACDPETTSIAGNVVSLLGLLGDSLSVVAGALPVIGGTVAVPMQWGGTGLGQGSVSLLEGGGLHAATSRRARRRLGHRRFTIRGGRRRKVKVHLNRRARHMLTTTRRLNAVVEVEVRDASGKTSTTTRVVKLRRAGFSKRQRIGRD